MSSRLYPSISLIYRVDSFKNAPLEPMCLNRLLLHLCLFLLLIGGMKQKICKNFPIDAIFPSLQEITLNDLDRSVILFSFVGSLENFLGFFKIDRINSR